MAPVAALITLLFLCVNSTFSSRIRVGDLGHGGRSLGNSIDVQAIINQGGVTGNVHFSQARPGSPVRIQVNLMCLDQYMDAYRWSIHEFPIRSSLLRDFPCSDEQVGGVFNPDGANTENCNNTAESPCPIGNLTSIIGIIRPDMPVQIFETNAITLFGSRSIIGRSLVIDREDGPLGAFVCGNIEQLGTNLEILRAAFNNGVIQGDVIIRYVVGRDDATVEVDLYRIDGDGNQTSFNHTWSLNYGVAGPNNSCDAIDVVTGSVDFPSSEFDCGVDKQRECPIGELTLKCGTLNFVNGRARSFCSDNQLGSIPRTHVFDENYPQDRLSIVIGEESRDTRRLGCAALEMVAPLTARSQFRTRTVFGDFLFWQNGPDDRTYVQSHLIGLDEDDYSLRIFTNAVSMSGTCDSNELGGVYNRIGGAVVTTRSPNCPLTQDSCFTGNLDAILPLARGQRSLRTTASTSYLPLFGPYTIIGRTIGLVRESTNEIIACSTIMRGAEYPQGELASILGYQDINNPPLPPFI